jgi:hypothetical protein
MKRTAIAITTMIGGKLHYIKAETVAANGEIQPEFTSSPAEMKEYDSHLQAEQVLPRLRNPFTRHFNVEAIAVWHKKAAALGLRGDLV